MAKLTVESTKDEEIRALNAFAANCADGSYLHQLMTDELVGELTRRIQADYGCDVYNDLVTVELERYEFRDRVAQQEAVIEELNAQLGLDRAAHRSELESWASRLEAEKAGNAKLTEKYWAVVAERGAAEGQLGAARQRIIELKAKLYDALMAQEEEERCSS